MDNFIFENYKKSCIINYHFNQYYGSKNMNYIIY